MKLKWFQNSSKANTKVADTPSHEALLEQAVQNSTPEQSHACQLVPEHEQDALVEVTETIGGETMQVHCVARSEVNQRENNEDSFAMFSLVPSLNASPLIVLAVADGMGGHAYGEQVSRETLRKMSLTLYEQIVFEQSVNCTQTPCDANTDLLSKILMTGLEQANAFVRRMVEVNKWGKAGSTLVTVVINENKAVIINLGDSPLFHYQTISKRLIQVTEDHTVAGVLMRAGMITPEMARHHEGKSRLEFFVGCPDLPQDAPIHHITLSPGDILLLCSDGISGSLALEQIEAILSSSTKLNLLADKLIEASLNANETDNQTLILWRYGELPRPTQEQQADGVDIHTIPTVKVRHLPSLVAHQEA